MVIAGRRRRGNATPILLVTVREALAERVVGSDSGADDDVVKPVHLDELAARLRALARRADGSADPLLINLAARSATLDHVQLDLSAR